MIWARLASTVTGLWLMAAPAALGYSGAAEVNDRIVGPVAASFAIIAIWTVTRQVRRVNTLAGAWLLAAPWLLGYGAWVPTVNDMAAGALLVAFSLVRGPIDEQFGGGWSSLLHTRKLASSPRKEG